MSERTIRDGTSKGTRTVWVTKSDDEGATWAKPIEITMGVKRPNWTWYATGPGVGIQMKSGRLVVPRRRVLLVEIGYGVEFGVIW